MRERLLATFISVASLFSVATPIGARAAEAKQITVVFRYDDYSAKSANTQFETRLIQEFVRHKIPCTFGVIPYVCSNDVHDPEPQLLLPLTPAKAAVLKDGTDAGIIEVSQHGLTHQTEPGCLAQHWTEFGRRSLPNQIERIRRGKILMTQLFGREPVTFIPPWNAYDVNTLEAAEKCGFTVFSGNGQGPVRASGLQFVPATAEPRDLRKICQQVRGGADPRPLIVVLFHEYDFKEMDPLKGYLTLHEFSRLLDWTAAQPDLKTSTLGQMSGAGFARYAEFRRLQEVRRLLPSSILQLTHLDWPAGSYPSLDIVRHFTRVFWALTITLYPGLFALTVTAAQLVMGRVVPRVRKTITTAVIVILSCLILFALVRSQAVTAKHVCLAVALVGLSIGSWSDLANMLRTCVPPRALPVEVRTPLTPEAKP